MEDSETWLSNAAKVTKDEDLLEVMQAFSNNGSTTSEFLVNSNTDAPGSASLDPDDLGFEQQPDDAMEDVHLGRGAETTMDRIEYMIVRDVKKEVDVDQAQMFGRRFLSVSKMLQGKHKMKHDAHHLLRLMLHRRAVQILSSTDPVLSNRKALRIRALVDFVWSQSLVFELKQESMVPEAPVLPSLVDLVEQQQLMTIAGGSYKEFSKGCHHATLRGITKDFGPVHINIIRIDLSSGNKIRMKCLDARKVPNCNDLSDLADQQNAVAAISGGFFLYSEPDIESPSKRTDPVGCLVEKRDAICPGRIVNPPLFRRATIFQDCQHQRIDMAKLGMKAHHGCNAGIASLTIGTDNEKDIVHLDLESADVTFYNRANAEQIELQKGEAAFAFVTSKVVDFKMKGGGTINVPLAGYVLVFPSSKIEGRSWTGESQLRVTRWVGGHLASLSTAMAGGPMFFDDTSSVDADREMDLTSEDFAGSAPPITFSQDETFDRNLLPRMGIGLTKDNKELVCCAIDGRNLDQALGLTLQGTSSLLRALGCVKAMNLDGGSSKRMSIRDPNLERHRVVCLSTTEIKASEQKKDADNTTINETEKEDAKKSKMDKKPELSRPIHTAILFFNDDVDVKKG